MDLIIEPNLFFLKPNIYILLHACSARRRLVLNPCECDYSIVGWCVCVCVALFLLNRYWGNVTVPGSFFKGRGPGVAGSSPSTLTTSRSLAVTQSVRPRNCSQEWLGHKVFTRQMAYYDRKIWQEIIVSRNFRLNASVKGIPVIFLRFSGFFLTQMGQKVYFVNFWWNHHKGQGILWCFGKRFAVIQEIITFGIDLYRHGIDLYRQFPSWDSISGSRCLCEQFSLRSPTPDMRCCRGGWTPRDLKTCVYPSLCERVTCMCGDIGSSRGCRVFIQKL